MTTDKKTRPIVIAHRGASGYMPEHTLAAYFLATEMGADYIEPDLVMTRDGVLVARHENALAILDDDGSVKEATTDIIEHPEFADRKTTKSIDGRVVTGWFTEDLTLMELRTLRACERLPQIRPMNARFDRQFCIPTFQEILLMVAGVNDRRLDMAMRLGMEPPPPIGVYPETKHPTYFRELGLPLEQAVVAELAEHGYTGPSASAFIQSFEMDNLRFLRSITDLPLIQLMEAHGSPYDAVRAGSNLTYSAVLNTAGLRTVATYANGIGVDKDLIFPRDRDNRIEAATTLVSDAHREGLLVHAWTFRRENHFLPANLRSSVNADTPAYGDLDAEIRLFLDAGIDGFFTDFADVGVAACRHRESGV